MAKPTSKSRSDAPLTYEQLNKIWPEILPDTVLERFRALENGKQWAFSGKSIRGPCPYCQGPDTTFFVHFDRKYAHCVDCGELVTGAVSLWSYVTGQDPADALADLKKQFGLKNISLNQVRQIKEWEAKQTMKSRFMRICHETLLEASTNPDDPNFEWAQPTVTWLTQTRQVPVDAIADLAQVGILPPSSYVLTALKSEYERELAAWDMLMLKDVKIRVPRPQPYAEHADLLLGKFRGYSAWVGSLTVQLDYAVDVIGRIKLRKPNSSETMLMPDEEELSGIFGLSWGQYRPLRQTTDPKPRGAYVVKNEFDAITIMSRMVTEHGSAPYVVVAGGDQTLVGPLDYLPRSGLPEAYLVPDAGDKGDELVKAWLQECREVRPRIFFNHAALFSGNDPDTMVLRHGFTDFTNAIKDVRAKGVFLAPQEWIFEKTVPFVEALDLTELRQRVTAIAEWGKFLKNPIESDAFVETCAKHWKLPLTAIRREIISKDEDEPAFVLRVAEALRKEFFVVGQEILDNSRRLYLSHRESGQSTWINLSDNTQTERQLGPLLGPAFAWYSDHVGIPAFLEVSDEDRLGGLYLQKMDASLQFYTRHALTYLAMSAPNYATSRHLAQGLHMVKKADQIALYLVNGTRVYHGVETLDNDIHWTELEGPSHEGYIFDIGTKRQKPAWLQTVSKVDDLHRSDKIDPQTIYARLQAILTAGWAFANHELTVQFLTAHLMASTVSRIFGRSVSVGLHAPSSSGKSRLAMGLISGRDFPRIHLMSAIDGMANFTAAGVRQDMNNCTRPLVLDEFEDEGGKDRKSNEVDEVYAMLRPSVGGDNVYKMGDRDGMGKEYHLNFFLFIAAINRARKTQDANRMISLTMQHIKGRQDPVHILLNDFGASHLAQLKDDLEVGMMSRIPILRKLHAEIEIEFNVPANRPKDVDSRYLEAFFPAMSVMKLLGMDYKKFIFDFTSSEASAHGPPPTSNEAQQLMDWVFQTPEIGIQLEPGRIQKMSLNQLLASPQTRSLINTSNCGIYYDEESATVVVNWLPVLQTILAKHPKFRGEIHVRNVREVSLKVDSALTLEALKATGALRRLASRGMFNINPSTITAYSVKSIISEYDKTLSELGGGNLSVLPTALPAAAPAEEKKVDAATTVKNDGSLFS